MKKPSIPQHLPDAYTSGIVYDPASEFVHRAYNPAHDITVLTQPLPSQLDELKTHLANRQAEGVLRRWCLIRDVVGVDPDDPWLDAEMSVVFPPSEDSFTGTEDPLAAFLQREKAAFEGAKQYLTLTGLLEQHPTEPSWVRILPAPKHPSDHA